MYFLLFFGIYTLHDSVVQGICIYAFVCNMPKEICTCILYAKYKTHFRRILFRYGPSQPKNVLHNNDIGYQISNTAYKYLCQICWDMRSGEIFLHGVEVFLLYQFLVVLYCSSRAFHFGPQELHRQAQIIICEMTKYIGICPMFLYLW